MGRPCEAGLPVPHWLSGGFGRMEFLVPMYAEAESGSNAMPAFARCSFLPDDIYLFLEVPLGNCTEAASTPD